MAEEGGGGGVWHCPAASRMHVLQMSSEVATLSKSLSTVLAAKRPSTRVLAEVVAQVAGLLEYGSAVVDHALKL